MFERRTFRLFKLDSEVKLEVVTDDRWKVLGASPDTGFKTGDEVTAPGRVVWREAKRRVNSARSSLSPNRLVLLRGEGFERSENEVRKLLLLRPWDPQVPPAA